MAVDSTVTLVKAEGAAANVTKEKVVRSAARGRQPPKRDP